MITREETYLLKGIAILMVVIQHIGQVFHMSLVNPLGPIGVFIFLFLSGYGLSCSYRNNGREGYIFKKLIKIYIPYVAAVILFVLWTRMINARFDLKTLFEYLILKQLAQGSYWYMILLFYWYTVFYLLTFVFDKPPYLFISLCIATLAITVVQDFNRLYVWQFASFPLGVITVKYPNIIQTLIRLIKKIGGGVFLLVGTLIIVIFKKMPYVESHELGIADTVLQIGITWCLGGWLLLVRKKINAMKIMKTKMILIGNISYEIYLSHPMMLNWFKENMTVWSFAIYVLITVISVVILKVFDNVIKKRIAKWNYG